MRHKRQEARHNVLSGHTGIDTRATLTHFRMNERMVQTIWLYKLNSDFTRRYFIYSDDCCCQLFCANTRVGAKVRSVYRQTQCRLFNGFWTKTKKTEERSPSSSSKVKIDDRTFFDLASRSCSRWRIWLDFFVCSECRRGIDIEKSSGGIFCTGMRVRDNKSSAEETKKKKRRRNSRYDKRHDDAADDDDGGNRAIIERKKRRRQQHRWSGIIHGISIPYTLARAPPHSGDIRLFFI